MLNPFIRRSSVLISFLAAAFTAQADERDLDRAFGIDDDDAIVTSYPGVFDSPPVPHWEVQLPGEVLNSATHTEHTRPVMFGEHIYVGSAAGHGLYVLSRRNGSVVRVLRAGAAVEVEPVIEDGRVYFSDSGGVTWCYSVYGTLLWSHDSASPVLVRPTVANGTVYITNVDDLAVALDAQTGALKWRYQQKPDLTRTSDLRLYGAPPAVLVDDLVLLGFSDGTLVALDADGGDVKWTRRVGEGPYPDLIGEPVVFDRDIFASGYFEPLVAIDRASQNVRWSVPVGAAQGVLVDNTGAEALVLHPGTDGVLRAVVALTGAERWQWTAGNSGALSTPVPTDAGLLIASSEGGVYLIERNTGYELWRYRGERHLAGVTAAPAVEGRQMLFITNAGWVHSMLSPQGPPAPWPPALAETTREKKPKKTRKSAREAAEAGAVSPDPS